ncbi:MAG: AI-2E family transporter [Myxococcales bacterium]|nr:AI-2E family transporter [Myxococcales bacterium]
MADRSLRQSSAVRAVVVVASAVVILAGLDAAEQIILPILLAVFLSIVSLPAVRALNRLGLPNPIAIAIVVVLAAGVLVGVTSIFAGTVRQFTTNISGYDIALRDQANHFLVHTVGMSQEQAREQLNEVLALVTPEAVMRAVTQSLNRLLAVMGSVLIVVVTLTFILLEASEIEQKIRVAFGNDAQPAGPFSNTGQRISRYLIIKTAVSAVTGISAGILCEVVGVDLPVMWGLIAFMLNYIPTLGSIVAAVPPAILALVSLDGSHAIAIAIGYLAINVTLGNFVEPRLLGNNLGLSPLVVFLSLVFWGWLWGPVGMLLCVPLTVMAKLVLDGNEDTRWLAVLLGSPRDVRRVAEEEGQGDLEAAK